MCERERDPLFFIRLLFTKPKTSERDKEEEGDKNNECLFECDDIQSSR